ncbi:hypothetical protein EDB86DRAFT_2994788 [Lactarius hatsudake]|nr:hypothetical protein EDB86DRAFT_2994788 [Lactarius hatsudake]
MGYFYFYYAFGLPTFLTIVIALYLLFTGSGEAFNVGRFLEESSPYMWASTGIGLCIGFSVLGAGWYGHFVLNCPRHARAFCLFLCSLAAGGSSSLAHPSSAVVSAHPVYGPKISSGLWRHGVSLGKKCLLANYCTVFSIIFCEVVAIYGVIMGIVYSSKVTAVEESMLYTRENYYTGYALFWGGLTVGLCNLLCGVSVGITGSTAALADAADPALFVKVLVVEIFGSILGLFGLIVGLLMVSKASEFKAVSLTGAVVDIPLLSH